MHSRRFTLLEEVPSRSAAVPAQTKRSTVRILLVDDHPDTRAALERLLTLRGHQVVAAHSMRAALEPPKTTSSTSH